MKKFELQQQDLELIVTEKTLGALVTNAKDIKKAIELALPNYDISNYDESNIEQASKDKALLNKTSKALNDKRITTEKEFMKPFEEFKEVVNETISLIKTASSKIDAVVQQEVVKTKDVKRLSIQAFWDSSGFELVSLDKVFDEKWLNKTTKYDNITAEITEKQEEIFDSLQTIEAIGEDVELLKSLYLDTLNLNTTIKHSKTLKENKERAKKEAAERVEAARIAAEMKAARVESAKIKAAEPPKFEPTAKVNSFTEVLPMKTKEVVFEVETPAMLTRVFRVVASKEDIIKLGKYMTENKINFEKVEM